MCGVICGVWCDAGDRTWALWDGYQNASLVSGAMDQSDDGEGRVWLVHLQDSPVSALPARQSLLSAHPTMVIE